MYCDDSVCRKGMTFCIGVGVHEANYAAEGFPEIQGRRRGNALKMGNLHMPAIVFVPDWPKFKQIWRSIWAIEAFKMSPQRRAKISANGGNLCVTATVFITQQPKFTEHVGPQYHLRHYAAQYGPQFRSLPPFNTAHYPPRKTPTGLAATHIIATLLWHSCF